MDVTQILAAERGCPVVVTTSARRIIAANEAACELLGSSAAKLEGSLCYSTFCGTDPFGNRFCHEVCAVGVMAEAGEPIRHFEIQIATAGGSRTAVDCSVLVFRDEEASETLLVHVFRPLATDRRGREAPARAEVPAGAGNGGNGRNGHGVPAPRRSRPSTLTNRETEVLQNLAEGHSCQGIAESLSISVPTARNHIQNILRKLDVHSQLQAVARAHREGLL